MHLGRTTLSKFLIQQLHDIEGASDLGALLVDVAAAVKAIAAMTAKGALGGVLGELDQRNVQGETQKRLDVLAKQIEAKDALIDELSKQNNMLLGSALPTVNAVMGALREAAGEKEIP